MISFLKPYLWLLIILLLFAILANGINLIIPKLISGAIDHYQQGNLNWQQTLIEFSAATILIFVFTYLQSIMQTYISEKSARDLRANLVGKISRQSFQAIQTLTPARLLTNLTADVDSIKTFVSLGIVSVVSSVFTIIGVGILLVITDWQLALLVLLIIPIIGGTFFYVFGKMRTLFLKTREVIDWLNKIINESILGAALIRVLNSPATEYKKFLAANTEAKNLGLQILQLFAIMIPIISLTANLAVLVVLVFGGHFVINDHLTLGNFSAFLNYINILIFPIIVIGFSSNLFAQASASFQRVQDVLDYPEKTVGGSIDQLISGQIELRQVSVQYGNKSVLNNVSFVVQPGSKTAIIGPTAAGKTQLLYLLAGLIEPSSGQILVDGHPISEYDPDSLHRQIAFVFQDSVVFNLSLKENIAFNQQVDKQSLEQAIQAAQLSDFVNSLPEQLNTIVSERGTSLSGGQKQRLMLARALALNPRVLLLDDFTARVDTRTENEIQANLSRLYPDLTLLSVTQKISSIQNYDHIILLMEGEVLAQGTHDQLLKTSPEYVQIFNSQQSTSAYEVQS